MKRPIDLLVWFYFGEMLHQLREDGASRVQPSLFSPHGQAERGQIQPVSIQIVPASTMRYRAYFQRVRPAARKLSRTVVIISTALSAVRESFLSFASHT